MKYLLKGLIVLVICMERALAISPIAYRNHIGQVRMNSPGIGNVILSDGTRYEESIQEIEGIVAREGKLPQPLPLDNLNSLTPAYWNLIVLSKYVKEMFTRSPGGGNCNSQGIDNLRLDLNRTYTGHEYDINVAIEDTKRHCNFINLYLPLNEMIGQPRQGQFLNRESNDWKRRSPQRLSGMPDVNVQYSLRNYEVEEFENVESLTGQHCNEVRIHPYDGYGQIGNGDFNARIPMTQQLAERIRNELGQYQVLGQDFIFSVESPNLIGNDPGEMSLKPQWAFERFYNGDVRCDVECWCKVFQLSGSRIVEPTYYYFPPETVILHQEGGLLRASNDSHHLGFGRDNVSRAVLYSVRYINGPIANTTKTGLILFIPNQGEYQYWTNSAYVYQNPIYQVLQAMRRDYWHLGIPFLNLLGIPPSGSI